MNTLLSVAALICLFLSLLVLRNTRRTQGVKWGLLGIFTFSGALCFVGVYGVIGGIVCALSALIVIGLL
ncbi:hypothetical protein ACOBV8_20810 (plasmid) [Pseudoalteromonas espejiana]